VPGGGLRTDDYIDTPPTHGGQWYGVVERALRREIREEVGLEIGTPEYLCDLAFIRPDGLPILVLSYIAPYVSGEVSFDDKENTDHAWVTVEEAKNYDLLEGMLDELEQADRVLKARAAGK
jgi:NADH pyrophosphatase NudC (nudix superfamily)